MAPRLFRWRAVVPLLLLAGVGAVLWALFADRLARATAEEVGTDVVGARVDIRRVRIDLGRGNVTLQGLTVGSPFEPYRNLLEADQLVADVEIVPLLEKKVVIDRIAATGLRFGTARTTPGFDPARSTRGRAAEVKREVAAWASRFDVPALQLATGRIEVERLDPARLASPQAARALTARADSSGRAWADALRGLDVPAAVDSVAAMVERLRGARATDLRLLNDARRTLDGARQTRDRLATLERGLTAGVASLQADLSALGDARRRDYALGRALLKLPALDAPEIGRALFAPVAIERFERALYWARLAREHMPPGLLPRVNAGPRRARAAGTTVRFPKERAYPAFLLRTAELSFALGDASAPTRTYTGRLAGLTSSPTLYGRSATFDAAGPGVRLGALVDHVGPARRDTVAATLTDVAFPTLALPSRSVRMDPGRGTLALSFALADDAIRARWAVRSDAVRWTRDSAAQGGGAMEEILWRVLSGVRQFELSAELSGTFREPRLAVRSNLDRVLAERMRAVLGEEVAAAERRVRAEVDRLVEEALAPARARVAAASAEATAALADQRSRLAEAQQALDRRLRELTRIRLP